MFFSLGKEVLVRQKCVYLIAASLILLADDKVQAFSLKTYHKAYNLNLNNDRLGVKMSNPMPENEEVSFEPLSKKKNKELINCIVPAALTTIPSIALAATSATTNLENFNPDTFRPVCPTSDSFYRLLQGSAKVVVGDESFEQFGPLIAEGLLRIRLELCVVESFAYEAVVPFIQKNGLTWVLPLHETVETFLAGTIFALATTFIVVGSTKIVTIIVTYTDVFIGFPCRLFGGFAFDRARGKPVTFDLGVGPWNTRVIGPKVEDGDLKAQQIKEDQFDFSKISASQWPFVLATGVVKTIGESSKVRLYYYLISTNCTLSLVY